MTRRVSGNKFDGNNFRDASVTGLGVVASDQSLKIRRCPLLQNKTNSRLLLTTCIIILIEKL